MRDLEARSAYFRKKDLQSIKSQWGLRTVIDGTPVKNAEAREAVLGELRAQHQQLRDELEAAGQLRPLKEGAPQRAFGVTAARAAGGALVLGLAGLVVYNMQKKSPKVPQPPADSGTAAASSAKLIPAASGGMEATQRTTGAGPSGSASPAEPLAQAAAPKGSKAPASPPSVSTSPPTSAEAAASDGGASQAPEKETGASSTGFDQTTALAIAAVVAGVTLTWLIWHWSSSVPPPSFEPPSPSMSTISPKSVPPASPQGQLEGGLGFGPPARAAEVVFENVPKEGQVWDMSASVRGIAGNVKERVTQFEGQ